MRMKSWQKFTLAILLILLTSAFIYTCCVALPPMPTYRTDYQKSQELFLKCLETVPAGPTHVKYNDWDEIVESCRQSAFSLSQKCIKNCP